MLTMRLCLDPVLREVAVPVAVVDDALRAVLVEMVQLMDAQNGAGLAAPQVGISKRFIVMRDVCDQGKRDGPNRTPVLKMINPRIVARSAEMTTGEEGCLSVLGPDDLPVYADVTRPVEVTVEWTDENGVMRVREFTGIAARIVQHECDHLDGVLFIDRLPAVKREMVMNKVKKRKN